MKKLSPSAAERWMACPGSHYVAQTVPPLASTSAADEGTLAHAYAAWALYNALLLVYPDAIRVEKAPPEPEDALATDDMLSGAQTYAEAVLCALSGHGGLSYFGIEVPLGGFDDKVSGRADFVAKTSDGTLFVVDYKFGGSPVPAANNPQLWIYAALAADTLSADAKKYVVGIVQPRAVTSDFMTSAAVWDTRDDLGRERFDKAVDAAYFADETTLRAPGDHCRWCPARSICLAAVAEPLLLACTAAGQAEATKDATDEQIGRWLTAIKAVDKVSADLARIARARISAGSDIPGWRISYRKKLDWDVHTDGVEEQAAEIAAKIGVDPSELIKTELRSPSEMKKTVASEKLATATRESSSAALIAGK